MLHQSTLTVSGNPTQGFCHRVSSDVNRLHQTSIGLDRQQQHKETPGHELQRRGLLFETREMSIKRWKACNMEEGAKYNNIGGV